PRGGILFCLADGRWPMADGRPVEPDLVISTRAWREVASQPRRGFLKLSMDAVVVVRGWTGHHVALDITASAQRSQQALVDAGDGGVQIRLQDTVQLDALTTGEAQRAVGMAVRELVHREVLLCRQASARNLAADHEHDVFAHAR